MSRGILFLNGDPPNRKVLHAIDCSGAIVVCTDGAYTYLNGVIVPDVLVGDFDSLSPLIKLPDNIKVLRYPADKDYTDGHLALRHLLERDVKNIMIYGGFGGRADHAYANLSLLYQAKAAGADAALMDGTQSVTLRSGRIVLRCAIGSTISLEPFFENVHIIQTKGLTFNLRDYTLTRAHALGVSNVAEAAEVIIEAEGELLVFQMNSQPLTEDSPGTVVRK